MQWRAAENAPLHPTKGKDFALNSLLTTHASPHATELWTVDIGQHSLRLQAHDLHRQPLLPLTLPTEEPAAKTTATAQ